MPIVTESQLLETATAGYAQRAGNMLPATWYHSHRAQTDPDAGLGPALAVELCAASHIVADRFELSLAIEAVQNIIADLSNVLVELRQLETQQRDARHRQLAWDSVIVGPQQYSIMVDNKLVPGLIRPNNGHGWTVVQLGFPNLPVETLEDGYDILLQRVQAQITMRRVQNYMRERRLLKTKDDPGVNR